MCYEYRVYVHGEPERYEVSRCVIPAGSDEDAKRPWSAYAEARTYGGEFLNWNTSWHARVFKGARRCTMKCVRQVYHFDLETGRSTTDETVCGECDFTITPAGVMIDARRDDWRQ